MSLRPVALHAINESARIKRLSTEECILEAGSEARRRARMSHVALPIKPVIRVFKAQGKPLLVLRVGRYFISSFTWDTLIRKAADQYKWKRIANTTLAKRWKE